MLRNKDDSKINSILGPEVEVNGDVKVVGSILIYGIVNGNIIASGTVRTAKGSSVNGNIESKNAIISGEIMGDLTVENKATLEHDCILNGNLTTSIVVVDEGATFKGLCNMIGSDSSKDSSYSNIESENKIDEISE